MSVEYDDYLRNHISNVIKGYEWLKTNLPELFYNEEEDVSWEINYNHDRSKFSKDEYDAYDAYFYGKNRSYEVVNAFRYAWLLHIHRNPHHWQHWVLINDDPDEEETILEMPYKYIIEMICDWWSFSWEKGDLTEIFKWYDEHASYIKLAPYTRLTVNYILWELRGKIAYNAIRHHGIEGQKWGVRNGPPYPIKRDSENITISRNKFMDYALNPERDINKARAFKSALGYDKSNCDQLISNIEENIDTKKMVKKGDNGYGMRYEQILKLKGANNKEANVLTAWIEDGNGFRLTSAYVTQKEETK